MTSRQKLVRCITKQSLCALSPSRVNSPRTWVRLPSMVAASLCKDPFPSRAPRSNRNPHPCWGRARLHARNSRTSTFCAISNLFVSLCLTGIFPTFMRSKHDQGLINIWLTASLIAHASKTQQRAGPFRITGYPVEIDQWFMRNRAPGIAVCAPVALVKRLP